MVAFGCVALSGHHENERCAPVDAQRESVHVPAGQSNPLLSIVVPSYNSQDYLHRCLDSMLPAHPDVEVIVVNDGSTDNTAAVAERYAREHPGRFTVINKPNGGHGSGINTVLQHARGEASRSSTTTTRWTPSLPVDGDGAAGLRDGQHPHLVVTNSSTTSRACAQAHHEPRGIRLARGNHHLGPDPAVPAVSVPADARPDHRTVLLVRWAAICPSTPSTSRARRLPADARGSHPAPPHFDLYHYHIGRPDQSVSESAWRTG